MKANEYQCAWCKGIFEYGWSEEEAKAEYEKNFPESSKLNVETDVICDDCYNKMINEFPPTEYEKQL